MKSFQEIVQGTKKGRPPTIMKSFSGMGVGREQKREQDEERKEQKKRSF